MATYVMSDIHGKYDQYNEMLKKIGFSGEDKLYFLGDACDRGQDGIKILLDMMNRNNVIPLLGNHDRFFLEVCQDVLLNPEEVQNNWQFEDWMANGGAVTLKAFLEQDPETQQKLVNYVETFEGPMQITVEGQEYILSHTAPGPERAEDWKNWDDFEATWPRELDYQTRYYENQILVTGHTPTALIDPAYMGKIWKGNGHIAIDCAAAYPEKGGRLGCIRLEDHQEFYV